MSSTMLSHIEEVVDGVRRYPRTGMKVIVVGAGIGGLMAGLESWRKGHEVAIVESSKSLSVLGDGFTISPSGLATLNKYPHMKVAYNQSVYNSILSWWSYDGKKFHSQEPMWQGAWHPAGDQEVSFVKSRPQMARMLYDQVMRLGIPIFWDRKVVRYGENNNDDGAGEAYVQTESGEIFTGDIVVAADGVGTKSHELVHGRKVPLRPSGFTITRISIPVDAIAPNSKAASLIPQKDGRPEFRCYIADDEHMIVMAQQDWIAINYTHPDRTDMNEGLWHAEITKEALLSSLTAKSRLDPILVDLIQQVPTDSKIIDWRLTWRDPLPQWASPGGRVVQLGDSAHTFLPDSGNGATQALEDALSLAECLRRGGKDRATWATRVHQLLRFERVSLIQRSGVENRERMHHALDFLQELDRKGLLGPGFRMPMFREWMWKHDPEKYAADQFDKALGHLQHGDDFHNTNIPSGNAYEAWTPEDVVKVESAAFRQRINIPLTRETVQRMVEAMA